MPESTRLFADTTEFKGNPYLKDKTQEILPATMGSQRRIIAQLPTRLIMESSLLGRHAGAVTGHGIFMILSPTCAKERPSSVMQPKREKTYVR
jgi:hypothetical protein